jgi:sec-independent protein translocase protein TatA
MSVGPAEILIILVVALVVFGPQRLPEVGRQVGSALRELRRMQDTVRGELDMVLHPEHGTSASAAPPLEPDDHTVVDGEVTDATDVTDVTSVEVKPPEDPGTADPGFSGPSDSFI